jgi:hypothetical protein
MGTLKKAIALVEEVSARMVEANWPNSTYFTGTDPTQATLQDYPLRDLYCRLRMLRMEMMLMHRQGIEGKGYLRKLAREAQAIREDVETFTGTHIAAHGDMCTDVHKIVESLKKLERALDGQQT